MMLEEWGRSLPALLRTFLEQGHVAVRTFFVLSGFVLARSYASCRWSRRDLLSYGVARFARIYPVYLVSLLVISFFIVEFLISPGISGRAKFDAITVYGFVLQGWMPDAGAGWNTPAWSLSCEFLFYLCLPILLLWLGENRRWKLVGLVTAALFLPIVLRRAGMPMNWKPVLHVGDFLVGIAAARIYQGIQESRKRWTGSGYWLYVPAMMAGIGVVVFPAMLRDVTDLGTALRPLNGMLVLGLALGGGGIERFLSTASSQYLGQASYSLYILHVPLLWWFGSRGPLVFGNLGAGAVYIAGIVAISAASFEWIEKPANRTIRDWARRNWLKRV